MRIAFVLSDMGLGGAQRSTAILANAFSLKGETTCIFTLNNLPSAFPLSRSVEHRPLGLSWETHRLADKIIGNLRRLVRLRQELRQFAPDLVIAMVPPANVSALLAGLGAGWPIVVSERSDPSVMPLPAIWRILRRLTYPLAHAIVVQTQNAARALNKFKQPIVIPNPVPPFTLGGSASKAPRPCLLAAGRLSQEKGFDLLITSFKMLADHYPNWSLVIAGEGIERAALTRQVDELGLQQRVQFLGMVSQMEAVLADADIFVLPSRYEGFPNALCEAMAAGLPAISFNCPSGPSDIIRHGVDGLLVTPEDTDALAQALDQMMSNESLRHAMGSKARTVCTRFELSKILDQWYWLLSPEFKSRG